MSEQLTSHDDQEKLTYETWITSSEQLLNKLLITIILKKECVIMEIYEA